MKKFVVGYLNSFDNVLLQKIVHADSKLDAAKQLMLDQGYIDIEEAFRSIEHIQEQMFNRDVSLGVIEI